MEPILLVAWLSLGLLGTIQLGRKGYLRYWRQWSPVFYVFLWFIPLTVFYFLIIFGGVTLLISSLIKPRWGYMDRI